MIVEDLPLSESTVDLDNYITVNLLWWPFWWVQLVQIYTTAGKLLINDEMFSVKIVIIPWMNSYVCPFSHCDRAINGNLILSTWSTCPDANPQPLTLLEPLEVMGSGAKLIKISQNADIDWQLHTFCKHLLFHRFASRVVQSGHRLGSLRIIPNFG